ncbi:hypothetical protein ACMX2M_03885 [Paenibacillus polymyxa]
MKSFKGVLCLMLTLVIGFTLTTNETHAASKKVSLKLSNGATYYGEVKNGKPNGKGTARWGENKTYSGDWVNGKRSGEGKYVLRDVTTLASLNKTIVSTYTGIWKNDTQNGKGMLTSVVDRPEDDRNEIIYAIKKGTFKNNKFVEGYSLEYADNLTISLSYKNSKKYMIIDVEGYDPRKTIESFINDTNHFIYYYVLDQNETGNAYYPFGSEALEGFYIKRAINGKYDESQTKETVNKEQMQSILKKMRSEFKPYIKGMEDIYQIYNKLERQVRNY